MYSPSVNHVPGRELAQSFRASDMAAIRRKAIPMPASSCISRSSASTAVAAPGQGGTYNREALQAAAAQSDRRYARLYRSVRTEKELAAIDAYLLALPGRRDVMNAVTSGHGFQPVTL